MYELMCELGYTNVCHNNNKNGYFTIPAEMFFVNKRTDTLILNLYCLVPHT